VGVFAGQSWWRPAVAASAAFSGLSVLLFWDGKMRKLADQGLIALIINVSILIAVVVLGWPDLGF
jgi:hypothetical protein